MTSLLGIVALVWIIGAPVWDNLEQTAENIHPFVEDSGRSEDPHSGSDAWVQQTAVAGCFQR